MTDFFIAGKFEKAELQNALRVASGLKDIVVLSRIEDCLELSQGTNWVTMYPDYNKRFPTFVSCDGIEYPTFAMAALAKLLNCEIAFEFYPDSNPNIYSLITNDGEVSTIELLDEEIEPM